jgi:hypothetical protein
MKRKTTGYKNKRTPDCEYYENGKCSVYNTKCCGYDNEECPVAIDNYDPYLSGDIEEW